MNTERKLGSRGAGPGDREQDVLPFPGDDVVDRKAPARAKDTEGLGIESVSIGNVHRDVLGPRDIETCVLEGQGQGIAASVPDPVVQPATFRQEGCGLDEPGAQVHADHTAVVVRREVPRRPAQARADVDDRFAGLDPDGLGQFHGRSETARVELIQGRQG